MSPGATFERVYRALKERVRNGAFGPGEHIEPAGLSEELVASITPVRDALHRLVGERLVEAPRLDGFRAPLISEIGVRHLYLWQADLALLALRTAPPSDPAADGEPASDEAIITSVAELAAATEALFSEIARRSPNPEHAIATASAGDRLFSLRLVEPAVLGDVPEELGMLRGLLRLGDAAALKRAIMLYHRRRQRAAPYLVEALHRLPESSQTTGL